MTAFSIRNVTQAGNNVRAELFGDHGRIAELHFTPIEYADFCRMMGYGADATPDSTFHNYERDNRESLL